MKKVLLTTIILSFATMPSSFAAGFGYLSAPNEGNRNFSTIMQHQFEKEETLDFSKNPDQYKEKRENKEKDRKSVV